MIWGEVLSPKLAAGDLIKTNWNKKNLENDGCSVKTKAQWFMSIVQSWKLEDISYKVGQSWIDFSGMSEAEGRPARSV